MRLEDVYKENKRHSIDCLVNDLQEIRVDSARFSVGSFLIRNLVYVLFVVVVLLPFTSLLCVQLVGSDDLEGKIYLVAVYVMCVAMSIQLCHDHRALLSEYSRLENDRR